jgi:hypothetical protein
VTLSKNGIAKDSAKIAEGIPNEVQIILIRNELQPYINTRFVLHKRYAVISALPIKIAKDRTQKLQTIEDELVEIEAIIAGYEQMIADLESAK